MRRTTHQLVYNNNYSPITTNSSYQQQQQQHNYATSPPPMAPTPSIFNPQVTYGSLQNQMLVNSRKNNPLNTVVDNDYLIVNQ